MIRQEFLLPGWNWKIIIFYDAGRGDAKEILHALRRMGCSDDSFRSAKVNLNGSMVNTGLTYTNDACRGTVMVISKASSPEEFWNTLDHEKGHAAQHIGAALGLDYRGEAQQYLAGEIARATHSVARQFI